MKDNLISPKTAAKILDLCVDSLRRYTRSGLLPSVRTSGGHRRFRLEDIERLRQERAGIKNWDEIKDLVDRLYFAMHPELDDKDDKDAK